MATLSITQHAEWPPRWVQLWGLAGIGAFAPTTPADDVASASIIALPTVGFTQLYDRVGGEWDRWSSVRNATVAGFAANVSGIGAVGLHGLYTTAAIATTDGQWQSLRMTAAASLWTSLADGAGTTLASVAVGNADSVSAPNGLATLGLGYGWDDSAVPAAPTADRWQRLRTASQDSQRGNFLLGAAAYGRDPATGLFSRVTIEAAANPNLRASLYVGATQIPGGAANGLTVDVTRVQGTVTTQIAGTSRTIQSASISIAGAGDTTVIAAPGVGVTTHIIHLDIENTSGVNTTTILKNGVTAINGAGFLLNSNGGAYTFDGQVGESEIILSANTAFVINLSGANQHSGFVLYYTV